MVEIYKGLERSDGYEIDIETLLKRHPKLELYEAVLISGYLGDNRTSKEFEEAIKKLKI